MASTDTTATVVGATYNRVENGMGLAADWSGSATNPDSTTTVDVLGDAATTTATPGSPATVSVQGDNAGATAVLSEGANGPVTLVVETCDGDPTPIPEGVDTCTSGVQFELTANFKDAENQPLYSFGTPAEIDWICPGTVCRHQVPGQPGNEGEGANTAYDYNYACGSLQNCGSDFAEREVEEDFAWYPVYISINGEPFQRADRCRDLPDGPEDELRYDKLHDTGTIETSAAQTAGFCVDVNAITRAGNVFTGALTIPVLFVEDLKLRP